MCVVCVCACVRACMCVNDFRCSEYVVLDWFMWPPGLAHAYTTHGHLTWHTNYNLTSAVSEMQDITSVREGAGMWDGGVGGAANEARPTQMGKDSVKCKLEERTYVYK